MGILLTIVVPAYNVEKYIDKCLNSFIDERIIGKLQVLVINDGSTDGTADVANQYCRKYPGIFRIISKCNGGHGSAINCGIENAEGEYFKVVDADDWVNTNALYSLLHVINEFIEKNSQVDVIANDFICIDDVTGKIISEKKCTKLKSQYGHVLSIKNGDIVNVIKMHSVVFRTDILKKNNIRIDEHLYYVDSEYITYPIAYCDTVYFINEALYMYRLGRSGQSMDIQIMQNRKNQHRQVIENMLSYYNRVKSNISKNQKKYIELCIAQMIDNQFQIYISMGNSNKIHDELKEWDSIIKGSYPDIFGKTEKKSVKFIRCTGYSILPFAYLVYKIVK